MVPTDSSQVLRLHLASSGWLDAFASRLPAHSPVVAFRAPSFLVRSPVIHCQHLECVKGYVRQHGFRFRSIDSLAVDGTD